MQRRGKKLHLRFFMVFTAPRAGASRTRTPQRRGVTITKKVGNAVCRNGVKRRVREVFRHRRGELPADIDIVFVAKRNAGGVSYAEVMEDFDALVRQLRAPNANAAPEETRS